MKTRVISAIVALMIFIPLVIVGGIWFRIGITLLAVLGVKEFLDLPHNNKRPKYVDAIIYALVIVLTFLDEKREVYYFLTFLIPFVAVIYCNDNKKYNADEAFKLVGMTMLIGFVFHKFIEIRNDSIYLLIYLFIIPMATDTFAQLGGMLIGKRKLAPTISPKKTWEGSITGAVLGTICAFTFYYILIDNNVYTLGLIIITLFLSCLGQLGDLFFSCVKRNHNIKDFSNIMPGHGGVLDRLDSIIFVVIGYILLQGLI